MAHLRVFLSRSQSLVGHRGKKIEVFSQGSCTEPHVNVLRDISETWPGEPADRSEGARTRKHKCLFWTRLLLFPLYHKHCEKCSRSRIPCSKLYLQMFSLKTQNRVGLHAWGGGGCPTPPSPSRSQRVIRVQVTLR